MKKIKLLSLLAVLFMLLGNIVYAQTNNTITRYPCIPGYQGCIGDCVTLTLSTVPTPQYYYYVNKYCGTNTTSFSYDPACTRIKVKIGAYTSTGIYSLPTAIGTSTIIALGADGEGVGPYTITIYKSANNQFKLSVGNTAY